MKRRILMLLLALMMLMSFVASCGNDDTPSAQETPATGATDDTAAETVSNVNPVGVFPIVNETITLTVYYATWQTYAVEGNLALEWFQEITNIIIDPIFETDEAMRMLVIASGDYPDIFHGDASFTMPEVEDFGVRQGIFIQLDDLIQNYTEYIKDRLTWDDGWRISSIMSDGHIYGLPRVREQVFSHVMAPQKFWINNHWLDELGLAIPTTTDEFRNVMIAFLEDDPNRNDLHDEIPISGAINTAWAEPEFFILNAFTYVNRAHFLHKENDVIYFVANTDEYREGLRFLADLYSLGLIDPSSFTQDLAQLTQLGTSEVSILGGFAALHPAMAIDLADMERSSHWTYLPPLRGPNGVQYAMYNGASGFYDRINVVITDRCAHPEAAMRMIDFMFTETVQKGRPDCGQVDWFDEEDPNVLDMFGNPARFRFNVHYVSDALRDDYLICSFPLGLSASLWGRQAVDLYGDIFDPANYEVRLAQATMAYVPFFPAQSVFPYRFDAETSEELATLMVAIRNHVLQGTTRFIVGDLCLDNDWESYVRGLDNLNVARYVEIHQLGFEAMRALG